jgi:photosystem II stability/assembly factor-like uncharacterized protein
MAREGLSYPKRGGTLLITDDAGETWSRLPARLPDLIDLAAASA